MLGLSADWLKSSFLLVYCKLWSMTQIRHSPPIVGLVGGPLFQAFSPISTAGREIGRKLAKERKEKKVTQQYLPLGTHFGGSSWKMLGQVFGFFSVSDRSVAMVMPKHVLWGLTKFNHTVHGHEKDVPLIHVLMSTYSVSKLSSYSTVAYSTRTRTVGQKGSMNLLPVFVSILRNTLVSEETVDCPFEAIHTVQNSWYS